MTNAAEWRASAMGFAARTTRELSCFGGVGIVALLYRIVKSVREVTIECLLFIRGVRVFVLDSFLNCHFPKFYSHARQRARN